MEFTDLLDQHDVPYQTSGKYCRPGWCQLQCPFCGGGSDPMKPYLGFNMARGYANCWNCGPKRADILVSKLLGVNLAHARKLLKGIHRGAVEEVEVRGRLRAPNGIDEIAFRSAHWHYLKGRGFHPPDLFRLWGVEGIGKDGGRWRWRLFIPIHLNGKVVSWTTRGLTEDEPRWLAAPANREMANHHDLLLGADYVRHTAIITEGPFDAFRIGPGAVCCFGTGISPAQVQRASVWPVRYVCFDPEPAAQRRAKELVDALAPFPGETYNIVLDSGDPAEATGKEIRQLRSLLD